MSIDQLLLLPPGYGFDNAAPRIVVPAAQSAVSNVALAITGTSLADADGNTQRVTLAVEHGTFSLASTTGLTFFTGDGTADSAMDFSGTLANVNTAIATLTYTSGTNYSGSDTLTIDSTDSAGGAAVQKTVAITVTWTPLSATSATLSKWWDASTGVYSDTSGTPSTLTGTIKRWVARYPLDSSEYLDSGAVGTNPTWQRTAGGIYYVNGDGSDDYFTKTFATALTQPFTMAICVTPKNTGADHDRVTDGASTGGRSFVGGDAASSNRKWQYYAGSVRTGTELFVKDVCNRVIAPFNGASSKLLVNGVSSSTANPGTNGLGGLTLFTDNALSGITNWAGRVAHVVFYSGALDATDQGLLDTYFASQDPS